MQDGDVRGFESRRGYEESRAHGAPLRADIQGLRAIAVLGVLVYHAFPRLTPGGFVGVDVFFVISGYLISGILQRDIAEGSFSLQRFYERRVRRLFPALYVMLAATLVVGALALSPSAYEELARTALSTIFFVSNVSFYDMSGYFESDAHARPLLHTWSLAVEEQFYLLYPLVLLGLSRFARNALRPSLVLLSALSFALCLWTMQTDASAAFYLAPLRAWELLPGAMLAGLRFTLPAVARHGLSLFGLALILGTMFLLRDTDPFPGLTALPPCVGAALILWSGAQQETAAGRFLGLRPFGFFGDISYSLYLWHWPILVLGAALTIERPTLAQTAAMLFVAVVIAFASRRLIEAPLLRGPTPTRSVLVRGGALMALAAVAAGAIAETEGAPWRFGPVSQRMFAARDDYSPHREACHNTLDRPYAEKCALGAQGAAPHIAFWADSVGVEFAAAAAEQLQPRGEALLQLTASGCPPALGYNRFDRPHCSAYNDDILRNLLNDERIDTVTFMASFHSYPVGDWPAIHAGFRRAVEQVAASGRRVVLIYPIPLYSEDPPEALGMAASRGRDIASYGTPRADFDRAAASAYALLDGLRNQVGAEVVRPADTLCDARLCRAYSPRHGVLYFNRDHLSMSGARLVTSNTPIFDGDTGAHHTAFRRTHDLHH